MFCREPPREFTEQQRDLFCVFSGDGISELRDFLNRTVTTILQEGMDATMYDDDDELDEQEGHVTGLMNATAINDDEYVVDENAQG